MLRSSSSVSISHAEGHRAAKRARACASPAGRARDHIHRRFTTQVIPKRSSTCRTPRSRGSPGVGQQPTERGHFSQIPTFSSRARALLLPQQSYRLVLPTTDGPTTTTDPITQHFPLSEASSRDRTALVTERSQLEQQQRGGRGWWWWGAASSTNRKAASPNFYICVRFLSHHSSAGSWVQPPPQRSLHFPAHLRCCCCAGSSSPCCSSGWAFYAISRPAAFIRPHSAASVTRRLAAFAECVSALFFPGVVVVAALVVLVGQRARSIAALIEAILNNNQL